MMVMKVRRCRRPFSLTYICTILTRACPASFAPALTIPRPAAHDFHARRWRYLRVGVRAWRRFHLLAGLATSGMPTPHSRQLQLWFPSPSSQLHSSISPPSYHLQLHSTLFSLLKHPNPSHQQWQVSLWLCLSRAMFTSTCSVILVLVRHFLFHTRSYCLSILSPPLIPLSYDRHPCPNWNQRLRSHRPPCLPCRRAKPQDRRHSYQ